MTFLLGFVPSLLYSLAVPLCPTSRSGPAPEPVVASLLWIGRMQWACPKAGRRLVRKRGTVETLIVASMLGGLIN